MNPNCTFDPMIFYMAKVYISLGSNEGDRLKSLVSAVKLIEIQIGTIKKYSSVVESEPWGFISETSFYNMVLLVETDLSPQQILAKALAIETSLGRTRHGNVYTNRIVDIDILFYDDKQINDDNLIIPHPLLHKRKFVLQPLATINGVLIHPVFHTSVAELLLQLNDVSSTHVVVENEEFARLLNTFNMS